MSKTPALNVYRVRSNTAAFDALVSRAFGPQAVAGQSKAGYAPAVESERDGEDLVLRLELPGVDIASDVNVEVVDGRLVIDGERRDPRGEDATGRRFSEFRYGAFKRTFRLGGQVGADQVSASYDAGVLTVRVANAYAKPAGQKIEIAQG
ncbi:HSP20 family protein [Marmoricola sp. OAE513]|uniref:Hsp20/alpha crystallin family protein n=1 Tax=Marmoricola sp. OAE513 TaxID=2817894 RepID=UPI001AE45799